jgi:hypothetical protein
MQRFAAASRERFSGLRSNAALVARQRPFLLEFVGTAHNALVQFTEA